MRPADLVREARERGVELNVDGERLLIRAPAGVLDDELRAALKTHKPAILQILSGPRLDQDGRPLDQCCACGSPGWWTSDTSPGWHCSHCVPRPEPFMQGRIVVVHSGHWGKH